MLKYWKADKATSARIIELLKERRAVFMAGEKMAKRVGAMSKGIYSTESTFGTTSISGFTFAVSPDPEHWVRLKNTSDGWRPRNRSPLHKEMAALHTTALDEIHKLIGMSMIGPGLTIRRAGINEVASVIYLITPEDVTPKGCKRITDFAFERATAEKKPVTSKKTPKSRSVAESA